MFIFSSHLNQPRDTLHSLLSSIERVKPCSRRFRPLPLFSNAACARLRLGRKRGELAIALDLLCPVRTMHIQQRKDASARRSEALRQRQRYDEDRLFCIELTRLNAPNISNSPILPSFQPRRPNAHLSALLANASPREFHCVPRRKPDLRRSRHYHLSLSVIAPALLPSTVYTKHSTYVSYPS
jgi:hypothetical protein